MSALLSGKQPPFSHFLQKLAPWYRTILVGHFLLWLSLVAVTVIIVTSGYFEGDPHGYVLLGFIFIATIASFLVALALAVWAVIAFGSIGWTLRILGLGPLALYLTLILWIMTLPGGQ